MERFFRDLNENQIKRGVFRSVGELIEVIKNYIAAHNHSAQLFIWFNPENGIRQNMTRARQNFHNLQSV